MQIVVGGSVVPVFPSGAGTALTLFNNGPGTIFLGNDTSLNTTNGFPLSAGSAIVWDKGQPLYLVGIRNNPSTLYYVENSGPSALGQLSLAPGATIGLASGSTVGLASGSSVAVSSLPNDVSHFWPCVSGESYPPTLGSGASYSTFAGNPVISLSNTGTNSTVRNAQWSVLARYSPDSLTAPLVVTGLVYIIDPGGNGNQYPLYCGYATGTTLTSAPNANALPTVINGFRLGNVFNPTSPYPSWNTMYLDVNGANAGFIDLSSLAGSSQWIHFELVYTKTETRLTLNNNTAMRCSGPAMADNKLTGSFLFGCPTNVYGGNNYGNGQFISGLASSYPDTVPA